MSSAAQNKQRVVQWQWVVDSPVVLATWAVVLLMVWSLIEIDPSVREVEHVCLTADKALTRIAADAAVLQLPLEMPVVGPTRTMIGRVAVELERNGAVVTLTCVTPTGGARSFACSVVPGAAAAEFGLPFSASVPELDAESLATGAVADALPAFRRCPAIALMHFAGGTDLDDFVVDSGRAADAFVRAGNGVVVVPGHLWIEPGPRPLALYCARNVTIVVRGNLYIGRSITVSGPGRLVLVAAATGQARSFTDVDGDGCWSSGDVAHGPGEFAGAIEGGGNAYLGLPRASTPLTVEAGIVVGGALHVMVRASVDGPLATARAPVTLGRPARLDARGRRLFAPDREVVPGFVVTGLPRPGLLREVPLRTSAQEEQALYATAPAR